MTPLNYETFAAGRKWFNISLDTSGEMICGDGMRYSVACPMGAERFNEAI